MPTLNAPDGDAAKLRAITAGTLTQVIAEDAPLGVALWPPRPGAEGVTLAADDVTLASVGVIRTLAGPFVEWTYRSGRVRAFHVGQPVAVDLPQPASLHAAARGEEDPAVRYDTP